MSEKDDGGSAFPGMTLREWYAGQALSGIVVSKKLLPGHEEAARWAFQYADAMINEAKKGK